jgi:hypothetical protein
MTVLRSEAWGCSISGAVSQRTFSLLTVRLLPDLSLGVPYQSFAIVTVSIGTNERHKGG